MPAALHRVTHLVAHRGNVAEFPANSLPALRSACAHGVRFALLDVQLAADEVPVVCGDAALAGVAGVDGTVFDLSADELARLDATWADGTTLDGASALPALADVAALLFDHPELTLLLELRRESLERFGAGSVVGRVREALRGVRSQCVLVSGDLGAIHVAREQGAARVGWILPGYDAHTRLKYEALRPDFLLIEASALPPPPARLWRGPWRWIVLGVNRAAEAEALAARGADFVATGAVGPLSAELRARSRPA